MKTAFLGLGSNLGDRVGHLRGAIERLQAGGDVTVARLSSVYATAPVGVTEQPEFLNLVAKVHTRLMPQELLARALAVEASLGRVRRERWGPRTIDIDLLWYEDVVLSSATLSLPHPRMAERAFVLYPLSEIAPELMIDAVSAEERVKRLEGAGVKKQGPLFGEARHASSA